MTDKFSDLFKATNKEKPAPGAIERLRQHIANSPDEILRIGNLANQVEVHIVEGTFGHSYMMKVAVCTKCEKLRADLGAQESPPAEKLLIDHAVICWMRLHICELHYEKHTKGASLPVALFWEHTLNHAQKRFLRSVETLARIRKLGINVQINVGQNQLITEK